MTFKVNETITDGTTETIGQNQTDTTSPRNDKFSPSSANANVKGLDPKFLSVALVMVALLL